MKLPCLLLPLLLLASAAQARIGDTADKIKARYGAPIAHDVALDATRPQEKGDAHNRNGFLVFVVYDHGKVVLERFAKQTPGTEIITPEVRGILSLNSGAQPWDDVPTHDDLSLAYSFAGLDQSLMAFWNKRAGCVEIMTSEYGSTRALARSSSEPASLAGF